MKLVKINGIELQTPTSWDEVTITQYYKIKELSIDYMNNPDNWIPEKYILEYATILLNIEKDTLYNIELSDEDWMVINDSVALFSNATEPCEFDVLNIDNRLYSYDNLNKMTAGEWVSIKLNMKKLPEEKQLLFLMSILVRPAKAVYNEEFDYTQYIVEPFNQYNSNDEILEKRMDLFNNVPITYALYIQELFMNGRIR